MKKIQGVFTALVTPFTKENQLNEDLLRELIRFQITSHVQGIVVLGSTGETPTLTELEKERIIQIAREETQGKIFLMVGTGCYSTDSTIENTRRARALGADAALIVTPYYNRPTQEGLFLHYQAISSAVAFPVMVYNVPSRTGQNLTVETLTKIAQLPHVCGVKEASGNITQIMEVIEKIGRVHPSFSVMSGDDMLTLPCIAAGGDGVISVASNLFPEDVRLLTTAALTNQWEEAKNLHYQLSPFFRNLFVETNPIPIKAAMELSDWAVGSCRLPLCRLSSENKTIITNTLKKIKLVTK